MPKQLTNHLALLSIALLAIVISYLYIDQPIAFWVNDHVQQLYLLKLFSQLSFLAILFSLLYLPIYVIKSSYYRITSYDKAFLKLSVAVGLTSFLKTFLKNIFGRTWPNTWIDNNTSLIQDGVFGFNFFQSGAAFQSFPSGHAAIMMAAMTVLWLEFPRLRPMIILLSCLLFFSQLLLNHHFFSDLLAGSLLGILVAYKVVNHTSPETTINKR